MDTPFTTISLCAGVAGLDLGVGLAVPNARTVCYVEREAFACEVLLSRMEEGRLDPAPVWTDVKSFDGRPWRGLVDLITGGYPCQPFSLAGKRRGVDDPRHLWPSIARIIREVDPVACFFENVAGHLSLGFDVVAGELQAMGYRVAAGLFAAEEVGAPHKRERLFILALADYREPTLGHSDDERLERRGLQKCERADERSSRTPSSQMANADDDGRMRENAHIHGGGSQQTVSGVARSSKVVADDDDGVRLEGAELFKKRDGFDKWDSDGCYPFPPRPNDAEGWKKYLIERPGLEPALHRSADGMAEQLDRVRACGNGVVPQQAAFAFETLINELDTEKEA